MNKIIRANSLGLPSEIKDSIKRIVDQMEKNNYAISTNPNAKRIFSRFIPTNYKMKGILYIEGPIIALNPQYYIERCDDYSFRIKLK